MQIQEGVDGVYAKIQCLCPDGCDTYVLDGIVDSPVSDIDMVVSAPPIIKHYPSASALCIPMNSEVTGLLLCMLTCTCFNAVLLLCRSILRTQNLTLQRIVLLAGL